MNRNRLRIRTCCLAATIMLAGSGSMAVNAAPAAGSSDELSTTTVSYTNLRAHETDSLNRMPTSA